MTDRSSDDRRHNRRRQDDLTLEERFEELENRLRKFFTKALAAFAIIGLASAVGLAGFAIVLKNQRGVSSDIQSQRFNTLLLNCQQQNLRHNRAIAKSVEVIDRRSQEAVRLIVDELQPFVADCEAYARIRVKEVE